MIKSKKIIVSIFLFLFSCTLCADPYKSILVNHFNENGAGVIVSIYKFGEKEFEGAVGFADIESKIKLSPEMELKIGSITKQFTAVAILKLVDRGVLSLDESIDNHFDVSNQLWKKITVRHLLTHTSGIPDYISKIYYKEGLVLGKSKEEIFSTIKSLPVSGVPGEKVEYSNSGYFLLGLIIEKISGMEFSLYLEDNIFKPLKMKSTYYLASSDPKVKNVIGYNGSRKAGNFSGEVAFSAGGLVSSAEDLQKWLNAVRNRTVLSDNSWNEMFSPYILNNGERSNVGLGWGIGELNGEKVFVHAGGVFGFSSFVVWFPSEKISIVALSNRMDHGWFNWFLEALGRKSSTQKLSDLSFTVLRESLN
ncbi:serine hydrolase domain-containing protein [Microbulbifer epialgicus]|uniref:Serine hydrolase domain-containing protein n=1 Tax=Microbulbifer epialgicus TaxID=393907 RepID=A0ABV4P4W9_9GAMM